jgi:hypothetical protein
MRDGSYLTEIDAVGHDQVQNECKAPHHSVDPKKPFSPLQVKIAEPRKCDDP